MRISGQVNQSGSFVRSRRGGVYDLQNLTLTTPWIRLLAALGGLGVPRIFILIIGMAYRYIFLLLASEEPRNRHD
jgi:hypothetical protein